MSAREDEKADANPVALLLAILMSVLLIIGAIWLFAQSA
jgi:hypothetical protein